MTPFTDFWSAYPHPRNRGSKKLAERLWNRLDDKTRADVMVALPMYDDWLHDTDDWRPTATMAATWLHQERWEGWIEQADAIAESKAEAERLKILREAEADAERRRREDQRESANRFKEDLHSNPERRDAWLAIPIYSRPPWDTFKRDWT